MVFCAEWITYKGAITDDNRDHCSIAVNGDKTLYVVADGSTRGTQSGHLAAEFVKAFADRFMAAPLLISTDNISSFLDELSQGFKTAYPAGRLSFLVLLDLGSGSVSAFHAGDCRLGRIDSDGTVAWLSRVHTVANAVEQITEERLASHDGRHTLTRSFRPGRKCDVEVSQYQLMPNDRLIMATDGYWADLNHEQRVAFIAKACLSEMPWHDDISCLVLSPLKAKTAQRHEGSENFYLARD